MKIKKDIIFAIVLMIVTFILFSILCGVVKKNGGDVKIDNSVRDFFYDIRGKKNGFIYYLFRILTEFGYTYCSIAILAVLIFYTRIDKGWFILLFGILLVLVLQVSFKDIFDRERPYLEKRWMTDHTLSFPSGHSSNSAILYGFLAYYFIKHENNKKIKLTVSIISIIMIPTIMISRMVLGMHYFTDVLAGMSLGLFVLGICIILFNIFEKLDILNNGLIKFKKKEK